MEPVVFLFPLPNLPTEALTNVLKTMDSIDIIAFSLISKVTKAMVVTLNLKTYSFYLIFHKTLDVRFVLDQYSFKLNLNTEPTQIDHNAKLTVADRIKVTRIAYAEVYTVYQWTRTGFGIREWVKHLKDVTNAFNIEQIVFWPESERYDIRSVVETVRGLGVSKVVAATRCSKPYSRLVYETILTPRVEVYQNPYPDRESLQKMLASNYESIRIGFQAFTLEEMLVLNCEYLYVAWSGHLTMATLNKFLKIWKTGFNTKFRYMRIGMGNVLDKDVILKGINHDVIDRDQRREFTLNGGHGELVVMMSGGYDIHGVNGMKATLFIGHAPFSELFFWN